MRPFASSIVAIVRSPTLVDEIRRVAGPQAVVHCICADDVRSSIATAPAKLVVYETGAWPTQVAMHLLAALCVAQPRARVLVAWRGNASSVNEMMAVVASFEEAIPVHSIATVEADLLRGLSGVKYFGIAVRVLRLLSHEDIADGEIDHCVVASLILSARRQNVQDLAAAVLASPRALSRHCLRSRLPRPVELLGWARALHVVGALENGASLRDIAYDGAESTARECSDYVRYHTGRAPMVWLSEGGFAALMSEFESAVIGPRRVSCSTAPSHATVLAR